MAYRSSTESSDQSIAASPASVGATGTVVANVPSGVADGDGLILSVTIAYGTFQCSPSVDTPAGWTLLDGVTINVDGSNGIGVYNFFRSASSEPASYNVTIRIGAGTDHDNDSSAAVFHADMLAYSGRRPAPLDGHTTNNGSATTNPSSPSIVTTIDLDDIVSGMLTVTSQTGVPATARISNSAHPVAGITPHHSQTDQLKTPAGATGGVSFTAASTAYIGWTIALAPPSVISQAFAASMAPSGALTKRTTHVVSASITPSGALTKITAKVLAASISTTGVLTVSAVVRFKGMAAQIVLAGALSRVSRRTLTASIAFSGSLLIRRFIAALKALRAEAVIPTALRAQAIVPDQARAQPAAPDAARPQQDVPGAPTASDTVPKPPRPQAGG